MAEWAPGAGALLGCSKFIFQGKRTLDGLMHNMERHAASNLLPWAKAVVALKGWWRAVMLGGTVLVLLLDVGAMVKDLVRPGPLDFDLKHITFISMTWFLLNVALTFFLALVNPALGCSNPGCPRFKRFPLFAWQVPAVQQSVFCWPACAWVVSQRLVGAPAEEYFQIPAHMLACHIGMQTRELVLFASDKMMLIHHVLTIGLSVHLWAVTGRLTGEAAWDGTLAAAFSICVMEAGSIGVCLWLMYKSAAMYLFTMTTSHILVLLSGFTCLYLFPTSVGFWVVCMLCLPLMHARHDYMTKEVSHGEPSGGFDDAPRDRTETSADPNKKIE